MDSFVYRVGRLFVVLVAIATLITAVGCSSSSKGVASQPRTSFASFDQRARAGEPLSVVFFGGSLTWGANSSDPQHTSYRGLMGKYLLEKYPKSQFAFHDAAIGGTGSKLGMFRLERDVLARKPDLVFLDFSANDDLFSTDAATLGSYECLLREMISRDIPVFQAFFGFKYNFGDNWQPNGLPRVLDHQKLAAAYHTGTGDMFPYIHDRLTSAKVTLDGLWPMDGAHPDDTGYQLFFEAVRDGFEKAIAEKRVCVVPEKPIFPALYTKRQRIRIADGPMPAGWTSGLTYRTSLWFDGLSSRWMGNVAICDIKDKATAQPLTVKFNGTMVGLFGEADAAGLSFTASVDGKPILFQPDPKHPGVESWPCSTAQFGGGGNLFMWKELTDKLEPGEHTLVITPVFPEGKDKGQLRIESICAAGH